jgi:T5SS/PEP-CTERM-associated repeat protein
MRTEKLLHARWTEERRRQPRQFIPYSKTTCAQPMRSAATHLTLRSRGIPFDRTLLTDTHAAFSGNLLTSSHLCLQRFMKTVQSLPRPRVGCKAPALVLCSVFHAATLAVAQVQIGGVNQGPSVTITAPTTTTSFSVAPNASTGTLNITNGSTFTATSGFARVGGTGNGTLNLDAGSTLTVANGVFFSVAQSAGSTGTLNASGFGTTINATGFSAVGQGGTGTMNLSNGATFNGTLQLSIGNTATGVGHVNVNSGATLNASGGLHLAWAATQGAHPVGSVTLDGAGTQANISNWFIVGGVGTGTASIQNGAVANLSPNAGLTVGDTTGSSGTLNIDGANSALTAAGRVGIGNHGSGSVSVSGGASIKNTATNNGFLVGAQNGGSGSLTVSGAGSTAEALGSFFEIGFRGTGTAVVENGGTLIAKHGLWVGEHAGANGTLTVKDAGSSAEITNYMSVGMSGTGTVNVENGAKLEVKDLKSGTDSGADLGRYAGGNGTLNISGAGSLVEFAAGSYVGIGTEGTGALNITNGGTLKIAGTIPGDPDDYRDVLDLGDFAGSSGSMTIDGAGSTALISGNVIVGDRGTGSISITNGGKMIIDAAGEYLGVGDDGGNGTVTIDGVGSALQVVGVIDMGHEGTGRIDVTNGGLLSSGVGMAVGNTLAPGVGQLNVKSGGTVQLGVLSVENGTVTIDGGSVTTSVSTFIASGASVVFNGGAFSTNNLLNSGLLSIDTQANDARSVFGTVQNNAAGYVHFLNPSDGSIVQSTAGRIHVQLDNNATVTFHHAVTNSGDFKVTQKAGTSNGDVFFNGTFTNAGTYIQDPTTSHFTDLINTGSFSAGVGDRILASGQVLNSGAINLTGSHLGALGGINNLGTISIFDSATIDGAVFGSGNLIFHVFGDDSHLTFGDSFFGSLEIVFDQGYTPLGGWSFLSFLNGVSFTQLIIGGQSYASRSFAGGGSLLVDGSFIPSSAVPEPSTYGLLGALGLLAGAFARRTVRNLRHRPAA